MLASARSCREILQSELTLRQNRHPAYSLRAFARDLELSPSRLSEILSGDDVHLSPASAATLAERLRFGDEESRFFVDLAVLATAKPGLRRELAAARVESFRQSKSYAAISAEKFRFLSPWYHLAILELAKCRDFEPTASWMAARLELTEEQVVRALSRLEVAGLIRFEDDAFVVVHAKNAVQSPVPSEDIRDFHRQIMAKAEVALEDQSLDERDFAAILVAVDPAALAQLKVKFREFRRDLIESVKELGESPQEVYALSMQWFRVTAKSSGQGTLSSSPQDFPSPKNKRS